MSLFIKLLLVGALAAPQLASAIEEPQFEVLRKQESFELRRYKPFVIAQTLVSGDMDEAGNKGFKLIADYIFGNNRSTNAATGSASEKIAMTAPVTMQAQSEKIAMTAPVTMQPETETGRWLVHFVMPSSYSLETLPKPNNSAVNLVQMPSRNFAVTIFSGFTTEASVRENTEALQAWMAQNKLIAKGEPQLARYNPPWTLPFWRRNEILIEVAPQ